MKSNRKRMCLTGIKIYFVLAITSLLLIVGISIFNFFLNEFEKITERTYLTIVIPNYQDEFISQSIISKLKANSVVKQINIIPSNDAISILNKEAEDSFLRSMIEAGVLPTLIEFSVDKKNFDNNNFESLKKKIESWKGVSEVRYDENMVRRVSEIKEIIRFILFVFGILTAVVLILMIYYLLKSDLYNYYFLVFNYIRSEDKDKVRILRKYIRNNFYYCILLIIIFISINTGMFLGLWLYFKEYWVFLDIINMRYLILGNLVSGALVLFELVLVYAFIRYKRIGSTAGVK
jgi:cell division protein FtsX